MRRSRPEWHMSQPSLPSTVRVTFSSLVMSKATSRVTYTFTDRAFASPSNAGLSMVGLLGDWLTALDLFVGPLAGLRKVPGASTRASRDRAPVAGDGPRSPRTCGGCARSGCVERRDVARRTGDEEV